MYRLQNNNAHHGLVLKDKYKCYRRIIKVLLIELYKNPSNNAGSGLVLNIVE